MKKINKEEIKEYFENNKKKIAIIGVSIIGAYGLGIVGFKYGKKLLNIKKSSGVNDYFKDHNFWNLDIPEGIRYNVAVLMEEKSPDIHDKFIRINDVKIKELGKFGKEIMKLDDVQIEDVIDLEITIDQLKKLPKVAEEVSEIVLENAIEKALEAN